VDRPQEESGNIADDVRWRLKGKKALLVFCSLELGGAERQGLQLARYLKEQGCDVTVFSSLDGPGLVADFCDRLTIPYEVHRFLWPCRKKSLVRDAYHLWSAIRRLRPDVIIPYTTSPNVGCGLVWRWTRSKACVWGQRNVDCLRGDALERFAYSRASAIICNAKHEVHYLRQVLGASKAHVHVIHNGFELVSCELTRKQWREKLELDNDTIAAVMVANFRPQKDHQTLLRGWRSLRETLERVASFSVPPPQLLLAGAPQASYEKVYALSQELQLTDSVRFLGQVKDISGLLAASDIGVLCSTHEGLSNSLIEYMASGLPVVATDLPGNREVLGNDPLQPFCKSQDADDLAVRLMPFILNGERRLIAGKRNRQRASEHFSTQAMCASMASVIAGLVDPPRSVAKAKR
jgi:glycosyltransferase involved in cell wall biosynthesis